MDDAIIEYFDIETDEMEDLCHDIMLLPTRKFKRLGKCLAEHKILLLNEEQFAKLNERSQGKTKEIKALNDIIERYLKEIQELENTVTEYEKIIKKTVSADDMRKAKDALDNKLKI